MFFSKNYFTQFFIAEYLSSIWAHFYLVKYFLFSICWIMFISVLYIMAKYWHSSIQAQLYIADYLGLALYCGIAYPNNNFYPDPVIEQAIETIFSRTVYKNRTFLFTWVPQRPHTALWLYTSMVVYCYGCILLWLYTSMVVHILLWLYTSMVVYFHGF